jgi:hypothetical protein
MQLILIQAGATFSLSTRRCAEILRESGFLPARAAMSLLNLCGVPDDLDAGALERYLRQHGAEICHAFIG